MFKRFLSRALPPLALGSLQIALTQEPSGKPDAPTPKKLEAPIPLRENSSSRAQSEKPTKEPETVADLQVLEQHRSQHTLLPQTAQPKSCSILVMNFTLPDGNTSAYWNGARGPTLHVRWLARSTNLEVIDRALLRSFLAKDRIPSQSIKRTVIHSIAEERGPRFLVLGTVEKFENGLGRLSVR